MHSRAELLQEIVDMKEGPNEVDPSDVAKLDVVRPHKLCPF